MGGCAQLIMHSNSRCLPMFFTKQRHCAGAAAVAPCVVSSLVCSSWRTGHGNTEATGLTAIGADTALLGADSEIGMKWERAKSLLTCAGPASSSDCGERAGDLKGDGGGLDAGVCPAPCVPALERDCEARLRGNGLAAQAP